MTSPEPLDGTVEYIYTGRRQAVGGGTLHTYLTPTGQQAAFKKPLGGLSIIGGTVHVIETSPSSVRVQGTSLPTKAIVASDEYREWCVIDRTATVAAESKRAVERMRKESRDWSAMTLGDLAQMSSRMLPDQRAALVALVIGYLR